MCCSNNVSIHKLNLYLTIKFLLFIFNFLYVFEIFNLYCLNYISFIRLENWNVACRILQKIVSRVARGTMITNGLLQVAPGDSSINVWVIDNDLKITFSLEHFEIKYLFIITVERYLWSIIVQHLVFV